MVSKGLIGGIVVVAVILAAVLIWGANQSEDTFVEEPEGAGGGGTTSEVPVPSDDDLADEMIVEESGEAHSVTVGANGYFPLTLTINRGESVTFVNEFSRATWPASNVHPTHTSYPGSGFDKCGTAEEDEIFDACRGLETGESYSFTFNEVGTWRYHDHLRPSWGGTIVVE